MNEKSSFSVESVISQPLLYPFILQKYLFLTFFLQIFILQKYENIADGMTQTILT